MANLELEKQLFYILFYDSSVHNLHPWILHAYT